MAKFSRTCVINAAQRVSFNIAGIYALAGGLWVLFSDRVLLWLFQSPGTLTEMQTIKGWFFVLGSTGIISWLVRSNVKALSSDIIERKRTEEELQGQLQFLQVLIDTIPNPIFYKNVEGLYLGCNVAFERFLGKIKEEIVGKSVYELAPKDLADKYYKMDSALFNAPGVQVYEASVAYADGMTRDVIFNKATFKGKDGTVQGLVGVVLDVTDRKRAEESLKEIQLQQQAILDNIPDLVWLKDNQSRFVAVNEAFAKACGFAPGELCGKSDYDAWPADLAEKYREDDARVMKSGDQTRVEELLAHINGQRKWIETIKMPIFNNNGEVIGTTGIARAIHTRKQAEEALKESEDRFHQIFAQNEDAIVLFRLDNFKIIDANPVALDLFGLSPDEIIELYPWSLLGRKNFDEFVTIIPTADHLKSFQLDKAAISSMNCRKIIASVRGKILRLRDEYVVYCSIRDVTEKVQLEEEVKRAQAKLIHTNKMASLGMLISSIAHEINNPNNCISVNAGLLAEAWDDATPLLTRFHSDHGEFSLGGLPYSEMQMLAPRLFAGIKDGSSRINAIITNMREYMRQDKGEFQAAGINKIIQGATSILWHAIHKHTGKFQLTLGDDLPSVYGNSRQIEQVVINLIMNALQALPDKGCGVFVSSAADSDSIIVTVRDEGKGMNSEVMARLTEPFFSTRLEEGGTGLGLYISSSVIKEHSGSIQFESTPGKGTTVTIRLPVVGC